MHHEMLGRVLAGQVGRAFPGDDLRQLSAIECMFEQWMTILFMTQKHKISLIYEYLKSHGHTRAYKCSTKNGHAYIALSSRFEPKVLIFQGYSMYDSITMFSDVDHEWVVDVRRLYHRTKLNQTNGVREHYTEKSYRELGWVPIDGTGKDPGYILSYTSLRGLVNDPIQHLKPMFMWIQTLNQINEDLCRKYSDMSREECDAAGLQ